MGETQNNERTLTMDLKELGLEANDVKDRIAWHLDRIFRPDSAEWGKWTRKR